MRNDVSPKSSMMHMRMLFKRVVINDSQVLQKALQDVILGHITKNAMEESKRTFENAVVVGIKG